MHLATYLSSVFVGFVLGSPAPAPTPPPEFPAVGVIQARVTTSFYSFVTTSIPHNARSIGMGLLEEGTDKYYWLYCIDNDFTTSLGFAGCGRDDIYTKCSGRVGFGVDGDSIKCDVDCVTHMIYQDLDATTFTPLVGCGRGTSIMKLLRESTGTGSRKGTAAPSTEMTAPATTDASATSSPTTSLQGNMPPSAGCQTNPATTSIWLLVFAGTAALHLI